MLSNSTFGKYDRQAIEREVDTLKSQLISSNIAVKISAVQKLSRINHKLAAIAIITVLNDNNSMVRMYACRGLGEVNYEVAVSPLIRRLQIEKDLFVLKEGIIALGKLRDERGRWILRSFLKHSSLILRIEAKKSIKELDK